MASQVIDDCCFVTGGAGFIGSHLVDHLISSGNKVTVYDNLSSGKEEFVAQHKSNSDFRFVLGDLLNLDKLKEAMKNHGLIFHLAANPDARLGNQDTTLDLKQETIVTYNVLESMRMNDIKKIIFSSSGTIYGETPVIPLDEDYGPVLPISLYGAGKLASEGLISAFCHTFDMQAWIFRFANIVGSRATHGVIFDLLNKLKINPLELEILGDGNQCKPYMHVSDCISGMIYGFMNSNMRVNVHNLGPDTVSTVSAIAEAIVQQYGGKNVRFKYTGGDRGWPGDIPQVRYDNTKMKRSGWQASMTSAEAIKLAITEIIAGLQ